MIMIKFDLSLKIALDLKKIILSIQFEILQILISALNFIDIEISISVFPNPIPHPKNKFN